MPADRSEVTRCATLRRFREDGGNRTDLKTQIAIAWLATLGAGIYYATSGPKKSIANNATPPLNAASSDEADFITCANSTDASETALADIQQEVLERAGEEVSGRPDGYRLVVCTTPCTYNIEDPSPPKAELARFTDLINNVAFSSLRNEVLSNHA